MINYRKPLRELLLIFSLSAAFRGYIIASEGMGWLFIASGLHGIISDLSLPLAITALALYKGSKTAINMVSWVNFLVANLICFDFLFFRLFQLRLCDRCFDADIMTDFPVPQRLQFAFAIALMFGIFKLIGNSVTNRGSKPCRKRLWGIIISALVVLGISNIQMQPLSDLSTESWDHYFSHFSFLKRSNLARSSFSALLSLRYHEQAVFPVAVFLDSPFFQQYLDLYEESASKTMASDFFLHLPKVWLHMQNSSKDAINALTNGIDGIETDVNFVTAANDFFVCHDYPLQANFNKHETLEYFLKSLEKVITAHQFVWLDIKNLQAENLQNSVPGLKAIIENCEFKDRIIIESKNQFILRSLSAQGLNTIWGALYGNSNAIIDDYLIASIRSMAILSGCKMVSLPFKIYDEKAAKGLAPFPIALYTINDSDQLDSLALHENVRVLLTDDRMLATRKR
jgi:hypothetical protein